MVEVYETIGRYGFMTVLCLMGKKSMLKHQILSTAFCREIHNALPVLQGCVKFNKEKTFIRINSFALLPWYASHSDFFQARHALLMFLKA